MDWYYLSDNHERISVSEAQLAPLAARGILRPATPVWRKGMGDWAACGEVKPEIFTGAVSGTGDHPGVMTAAVNGTVIGLARTLSGYNLWLRIFGITLLVAAVCLCISTVTTVWYLGMADDNQWKLMLSYMPWASVPKAAIWALTAFQGINILLTAWCGFLILCAASRAKQAALTGNEHVLVAAIRDTGRYFLTTVLLVFLGVIFWISMFVWFGRNMAFPSAPGPAEKAVSI